MNVDTVNLTLVGGAEAEDDYDNVPTEQDVVKKLDMEFATPLGPSHAGGKSSGSGVDFDPKKDNMRVFLRIRPFSDDEINRGEDKKCIDVLNEHTMVAHAPKDSHTYKNSVHGNTKASNKFTFSKIFGQETSQKEFFDTAMLGTVKDFVDGQNCLMFTYGVTNSGKTYTIQGVSQDGGILPRALDVLFNSIAGKQLEDVSLKPKMFCDVVRLSTNEKEREKLLKDNTLKMAAFEEPDMNTLLGGGDTSDVSALTVNSTTNTTSMSNLSEDSLMTSRASVASSVSTTKASLDSISKDSIDTLLEEAEERVREEATIDVDFQGQVKFGVWVSFAEIYNEQIFDLLEPPPKKKTSKRNILHLREDKNGTPYIKGLKEIGVNNADEAYQILNIGKKNLQFACTKLNHNSSRSHCIFTVKLVRVVDKDMPHMARMSMLSLCDLAGSERYSKTQSLGDRIKEASNINTSLLTLGRCIKTLRHNQLYKDQPRIVPFRDSKLTRVFQSFFCGKGRASMVVNINQVASLFDETLHALKYSAIAKEVIVTQEEEEKKAPPPKKRGAVSLALRQLGRDRTTIGWATPGTIAKIIEEEEAGCNLPLPEDDDEDLLEPSDEATKITDLLEVVEHLKAELINARKGKIDMEMNIREEVCKEMAEQLVQIESQYSERVREAQYLAEEKAEKKIELLTMSMKKTKKRKRFVEQDEDEEYVSSVLLHAEQVKVQERDLVITQLKKEKLNLEKTMKEYADEKEVYLEKSSKLQFKNTHLNEKLQEFSNMVEEQAQLFKENNEQLLQLEQRIWERDSRIAELEQMVQSKACPACQESTTQMGDLISKLADTEQQLTQKEEAIIKMEQMSDMVTCDLCDKVSRIEELEYALSEAQRSSSNEAKVSRTHIETQTDNNSEDTDGESMEKLQEELEKLKAQLELKDSEIVELKENNEVTAKNTNKISSDKDAVIEELNRGLDASDADLKQARAELEVRDEEVARLKDKLKGLEVDIEDLTADLDHARCCLEDKTDEIVTMRTATDLNEAMKERLNHLEEELEKEKEAGRSRNKSSAAELGQLKDMLKQFESNLQTKEMDLTKCETDMFEALEKVSEGDLEFNKLKSLLSERDGELAETQESLEEALKVQSELRADGEALRSKISSLEITVKDSESVDLKNVGLAKQVEEQKCLLVEKDKALNQVTQQLRGLRESLDSESGHVTSVEASLHQANEAVRNKGLELKELENRLEDQQSENCELKEYADTLKSQVLELSENHAQECSKVKVLDTTVSDLEREIGLLKSKMESHSKEKEEGITHEFEEMKSRLTEEHDKLEMQVKGLQAKLEEKEQIAERLCGECEKLKKSLEGERKDCRGAKNQLQEVQCLSETLEIQLKHEKGEREENKAEVSKLQLHIHELEHKLRDTEASLKDSTAAGLELERKVAGLQVSLDVAGEIEEDLQEITASLEQITEERDRLHTKQGDMEQEMAQLRAQGDQVTNSSEELVQDLRAKIRQLEAKVEDAEYKNQMTSRQMRREKAQVEKLLKETEGSLTEAEEKVNQLEEQLSDVKATERQLYDTKVEQHRKKAEKLQDVVHDLEHCLRSSKDSEAKVQALAEEYRQKYRDLEKQYATVEDQLKDLYDKRDSIASEKDHNEVRFTSVIEEKQKSMEELRSTISDLREEIITLQDIINRNAKDFGQQMYDKNEHISNLENELEKFQTTCEGSENTHQSGIVKSEHCDKCQVLSEKLEQFERRVHDKDSLKGVEMNRICVLESEVKEKECEIRVKEERIDELEGELEEKQREAEVHENRLECIEQELEARLRELQEQGHLLEQLTQQTNQNCSKDEKLVDYQKKINGLEEEQREKVKRIDQLEAGHKEQETKIDVLEAEHREHVTKIAGLEAEHKEQDTKIDMLEERHQENVKRLEEDISGRQEKIDMLEAELSDSQEKIDGLEAALSKNRENMDSLEAEFKESVEKISQLEAEVVKLKDNHKETLSESEKLTDENNRVREELSRAREEFEKKALEQRSSVDELMTKLTEKDGEIDELKNECETVKDSATADVTALSCLKVRLEALESDLQCKTTELEQVASAKCASEEKFVTVEARCCTLQEELHDLRVERDSLQEQGSLSRQEVSRERLNSELESVKLESEELRQCKQRLEKELAAREKSIESYNKRIGLLKEESQQLSHQLEKSQESESKLRAQMREASSQMEEQNAKFVLLQEKLRLADADRETQGVRLEATEKKLQEVKSEVEALKLSVQSKEDQCHEVKRAGQQQVDGLRLEVKQLQLDLEVKDKRLEKKNKKISELLQEGMDEGKKYEIAYHDAQANEKVIEQLKKAMEEQEQVMEMQDTHMKKKEEEYEQLLKEVDLVTEKYNALLKESAESTSQLRQVEHSQRKSEAERSELRREAEELQQQLKMTRTRLEEVEGEKQLQNIDRALVGDLESRLMTAKTEHEQTKQNLIRREQEKLRLEADIKACNRELRDMEKELGNARKEREHMRREVESSQEKAMEMTRVKDKLQEDFSQSEVARNQVQLLKQKFHGLEEQKAQLEKEIGCLKDQIKTADDRKELELQKWRVDRDKLVSQLQEIMAKKDAEIKVLKEASAGSGATVNNCEELASLKSQLSDRDAIIAELSSHLDKPAKTRRTGRQRKGSQSSTAGGGGSDEEMDSLKKELASLHQQLEAERQNYVKQTETQIKAKNAIISDLKDANETLQSHLKRLSLPPSHDPLHALLGTPNVEEESFGIQCDLDGTPTLHGGASSSSVASSSKAAGTTKSGKTKRGRPKKRKSSETDDTQSVASEDLSEPHSSSTKHSRGGGKRASTRHPRTHKKSFHLDENDEPDTPLSMGVIKEEDVVDLSMLDMNKSGAKALNNSTNILDLPTPGRLLNSTPKSSEHRQPTFVSPCTDTQPRPSTIKKKKRLHKTEVEQPFSDSPNLQAQGEASSTKSDAHQIVKRKLRTRKR